MPLNSIGNFIGIHEGLLLVTDHFIDPLLLRLDAGLGHLLKRLDTKIIIAEGDQDSFPRIYRSAMRPRIEIVSEHESANNFEFYRHEFHFDLLPWYPFPASSIEIGLFRVIKLHLMSFFEPITR